MANQLDLILKLQKELLEDAVKGKLLNQDNFEGNSQDVLDEVRENKKLLVKTKKTKEKKKKTTNTKKRQETNIKRKEKNNFGCVQFSFGNITKNGRS